MGWNTTDVTVDIELTNRCNATCCFCPRDRTPAQGRMSDTTFSETAARILEFQAHLRAQSEPPDLAVSFCGLGEPLLHSKLPEYVGQIRQAGIPVTMSSNAALLDAEKGAALLDAGLDQAFLNVGAQPEDYERVYGLSFERTRSNVERFAAAARGRCRVVAVVVDHEDDLEGTARAVTFWRTLGVGATVWSFINRAGSLESAGTPYEARPDQHELRQRLRDVVGGAPACHVPLQFNFVGWDGHHYLCSSDWEKRSPHGHVSHVSFVEAARSKMAAARDRRPICEGCTHDPVNRLSDGLLAGEQPPGDLLADVAIHVATDESLRSLGIGEPKPIRRPSIPVAVR